MKPATAKCDDILLHKSKNQLSQSLLSIPLLLIGAGGIGCELLKVLVLYGFRHIHIIDLDTIDATNLNRQFLFTADDIGQPKALVARNAVLSWFTQSHSENTSFCLSSLSKAPTIMAHCAQIQAPQFDEAYFAQFGAVLSALDNVQARQHVNRMCAKVRVPLVESGTMGYNGQVQPICYGVSECYDCRPKPADTQTFAVCTIHAHPTTMVHCVHFAKELYATLFGCEGHSSDDFISEENKKAHQRVGADHFTNVDNNHSNNTNGNELSYVRSFLQHYCPSS
uniref:SUMO-activating enzyme subunit 2 n=1 Tax=Lygus hesperus TaxID=30085 RepID=A0A0A9W503_LYGHE